MQTASRSSTRKGLVRPGNVSDTLRQYQANTMMHQRAFMPPNSPGNILDDFHAVCNDADFKVFMDRDIVSGKR